MTEFIHKVTKEDEGMEVQTPSGICEEVQRQAESADL